MSIFGKNLVTAGLGVFGTAYGLYKTGTFVRQAVEDHNAESQLRKQGYLIDKVGDTPVSPSASDNDVIVRSNQFVYAKTGEPVTTRGQTEWTIVQGPEKDLATLRIAQEPGNKHPGMGEEVELPSGKKVIIVRGGGMTACNTGSCDIFDNGSGHFQPTLKQNKSAAKRLDPDTAALVTKKLKEEFNPKAIAVAALDPDDPETQMQFAILKQFVQSKKSDNDDDSSSG